MNNNDIITTAEELGALHRAISDAAEPALVRAMTALWIVREGEDGELSAGSAYSDGEGLIPASMVQLPWTVLFRPGQPSEPARCAPSREDLLDILRTHDIECTGIGDVTCRGCRDRGWMTWRDYRCHVADAIQDLYAVQRTEAEAKAEERERVIEAVRDYMIEPGVNDGCPLDEFLDRLAATQPLPGETVDAFVARILRNAEDHIELRMVKEDSDA